jgi:glycosyltransferase involved in cell wall biosynthesis
MNKPLVSVLMTVYNREKYIEEAIESVIASTYQNWELIIVDDQSKDKSVEIARQFELKDSRIKLHVNGKNLGDYPNRNQAAKYANGKYLKYLDSDDLIYPHGLEAMVSAMEKYPAAAFGMPGIPNGDLSYPILSFGSDGVSQHFLNGSHFIHGPSSLIFNRKAFEAIEQFGTNPYVGSDIEIQLRLAIKYDYVLFQPALIWWRNHADQEIKLGHSNFQYYLQGYSRSKKLINECAEILKSNQPLALTKLRNLYIMQSIRLIRAGHLKKVLTLLKEVIKN